MVSEDILRRIGDACVAHADYSFIGAGGGQVDVFTTYGRYHAAYGHPDGDDPVRHWCERMDDMYGLDELLDRTITDASPIICTLTVHNGKVDVDVRETAPLPEPSAYVYLVDGVEMERRFVHEEFPEGTWSDDLESAWAAFREEVEDATEDIDVLHSIVNCATVTLLFQSSEIKEYHYFGGLESIARYCSRNR